jgi:hypothetical protein
VNVIVDGLGMLMLAFSTGAKRRFSSRYQMKKYILLSSLFLSTNLWALIGETPEQSDARYGTPYGVRDNIRYYTCNGFDVTAKFLSGICQELEYSRSDILITPTESNQLLHNNGSNWREYPNEDGGTDYLTPSGLGASLLKIKNPSGGIDYVLSIDTSAWRSYFTKSTRSRVKDM